MVQPSFCKIQAPNKSEIVPFTVKKITPAQPNLRKYAFQCCFSMCEIAFMGTCRRKSDAF